MQLPFNTTLPDGKTQRYVYYTFNTGEGIPLHDHDYWHSSCCLEGKYEVYDDTGKTLIVDKGMFVEFKAGRKHGIKALVDGTALIHINEPGH